MRESEMTLGAPQEMLREHNTSGTPPKMLRRMLWGMPQEVPRGILRQNASRFCVIIM